MWRRSQRFPGSIDLAGCDRSVVSCPHIVDSPGYAQRQRRHVASLVCSQLADAHNLSRLNQSHDRQHSGTCGIRSTRRFVLDRKIKTAIFRSAKFC